MFKKENYNDVALHTHQNKMKKGRDSEPVSSLQKGVSAGTINFGKCLVASPKAKQMCNQDPRNAIHSYCVP